MKRKTFIPIGLTVFLSIGLLAGCQNKVLDYSTDETGSSIPMPITGETKWTEKLEGKQEDGSTVEIAIDADIVIPDADNMSVIEVEEPIFDAEYKEKILKEIFGENPVYHLEDYQTIADYEVVDAYQGEIKGVTYTLVFEEAMGWTLPNYRWKSIDLEPENRKDVVPEELKIYDTVSYYYEMRFKNEEEVAN